MEKTLSELNNYIDLLLDTICVVDKDGRFVYVSSGCKRLFGYTADELIGRAMITLVHPDDRDRTLQTVRDIMAGQHKFNFENRYIRKDGEIVHIAWSARLSDSDQLRISVARDISANKHAEALQTALYAISEAAHKTEDLLALYKQIHQIIDQLMNAKNFAIALHNNQTGEITFPYKVKEHIKDTTIIERDSASLCAEIIRSGNSLLLTPDTTYKQSWLGVPLKSSQNIIGALIVQSYPENSHYSEKNRELLEFVSTQIASAIERKQMLERLEHMALYDQLTQLPNRELFLDRLQQALATSRRQQTRFALFYLDLDKFKQVNDSFGHHSGDELLQQTAHRILHCVRESDTVARLSGDEFVVLLENIESTESAIAVAEKIRHTLNQSFDLGGETMDVLPSIGIALFPQHGDDEKQLLRRADEAMYNAKKNGGNRVAVYSGK